MLLASVSSSFTSAVADHGVYADAETFFADLVRGVVEHQKAVDAAIARKLATNWRLDRLDATARAILRAGAFELIQERKWDNTPDDELRHDVTDELAAYKLAQLPFPGVFGVFYETDRPTKNALEKRWIDSSREKLGGANDQQILQKTFDRMK